MAKKADIEKVESAPLQPLENIENLIQVIRGKQVILDRDLARLYGVEEWWARKIDIAICDIKWRKNLEVTICNFKPGRYKYVIANCEDIWNKSGLPSPRWN